MWERFVNALGDWLFLARSRLGRTDTHSDHSHDAAPVPTVEASEAGPPARGWRRAMEGRSAAVGVVAVVAILVAVGSMVAQTFGPPRRQASRAWFYDLGTGTLFAAPAAPPPIAAPSGKLMPDGTPAGVLAYVFSCGSCDDETSRFVGYLETHTRAMTAAPAESGSQTGGSNSGPPVMLGTGQLLAQPSTDPEWVSSTGEAALETIRQAYDRCGPGRFATACPAP